MSFTSQFTGDFRGAGEPYTVSDTSNRTADALQ